MSRRLIPFAWSAAVMAADRVSKLWVQATLTPYDSWVIVPGFFNLIHTENRGMAFSLFADADESTRRFLLIGVSLAVMAFIAVMLWQAAARPAERVQSAALSLVLGGASGNIYDRIAAGAVTDFLDVYIGEHHWPTFNVADSAITIGALLLLLDMWRGRARQTAVA
ncbi:MAG: signal peptidase II [Acidimicrobiia bacterium]|nr:signal peptidase II [Acidimicrobiia bacterium]